MECKSEYDKIDFDENDIAMLRAWYLDDNGAFTLDHLKAIKKIRDEYYTQHKDYFALLKEMVITELSDVKAIGDKGVALFGFAIVLLPFLVTMKKRYYVIPIFLCLIISILYFYLWNTGRNLPFRGVYMLWICSEVYLLYSFSPTRLKNYCYRISDKKVLKVLLAFILIVSSLLGFFLSIIANYTTIRFDNKYSIFYILKDTETEKQIYSFNNTYYRYKNYERHMSEFGTNNMYENLLNDNVYFVCTPENDHSRIMKDYLTKYYNNHHSVISEKIKTLNSRDELDQFFLNNKDKKFELSMTASSETASQYIIYQYIQVKKS